MRRFAVILLTLVIALSTVVFASGCSSKKQEETTEAETPAFVADFYKIYDEGKTMQVELDSDPASGYNWTYKISDENILTLTSFVFNPPDDTGKSSVWSASFTAGPGSGGDVRLSLYSVQNPNDVEKTDPVYIMDLNVTVDGKISVTSIKR